MTTSDLTQSTWAQTTVETMSMAQNLLTTKSTKTSTTTQRQTIFKPAFVIIKKLTSNGTTRLFLLFQNPQINKYLMLMELQLFLLLVAKVGAMMAQT